MTTEEMSDTRREALAEVREMARRRAEVIRANGLITDGTPPADWWRLDRVDGPGCLIIGPYTGRSCVGPYPVESLYFQTLAAAGVPHGAAASWSNSNGVDAVLQVLDAIAAGEITLPGETM